MNNSILISFPKRPHGVTFLAIINYIAFIITVAFWAMVYFGRLVPAPGEVVSLAERANAAVTFGFMIADILFSVPLLLLAGMGLWRLQSWGWLAAQMVNILWIYSMTVILWRDAYTVWSPGGLLFIPFAIVAIVAIPYLWIQRRVFGIVN